MHPCLILRNAEPPAMNAVRQMLKSAMKSKNEVQKTTMRAVMAAVKNADIAKPGSMKSDLAFAGLLNSLIKKRTQSAEEYLKGERQDLASNETREISVLNELMEQLEVAKPEELESHVSQFLNELKLDLSAKDSMKSAISKLPKDVEQQWRSPRSAVMQALKSRFGSSRGYATAAGHENPLGLRRRSRTPTSASNTKLRIPNVKRVILVSSAKGGVGKSTVSANLAMSLHGLGYNTALLDADIFGPSIPKMLGLESFGEPRLSTDGSKLLPLVGHGVKAMSMGFLVPANKSVSWRGLLVQKALHQLLFEVEWGPTDYLVVDMPPGTGDVQLTIGQQLLVDGTVFVSTPQQVALADAQRGVDLFKQLQMPILGYVENMAYFECPCCGDKTRLFGPPAELEIAKLAEIPLQSAIAADADSGAFAPRAVYMSLAENVARLVPI